MERSLNLMNLEKCYIMNEINELVTDSNAFVLDLLTKAIDDDRTIISFLKKFKCYVQKGNRILYWSLNDKAWNVYYDSSKRFLKVGSYKTESEAVYVMQLEEECFQNYIRDL